MHMQNQEDGKEGEVAGDIRVKYRLLAALKTLRDEEMKNRSIYNAPWITHPDHVRHYFQTFGDYLEEAGKLDIIDSKFLDLRLQRLKTLKAHRDNMSSLMGMVSELMTLIEHNLEPYEEIVSRLKKENIELKERLKNTED